MTDIRTAAGIGELAWLQMSGPAERMEYAMRRLQEFARHLGPDHPDTETLAVALVRWQGGDPYLKHLVMQNVSSKWPSDGRPTQTPRPFRYAWQVLVARVREEPI